MKPSYILILALLGVSALSLASATKGSSNSRPPVVIKTNETGIVTLDAVNTALNRTWNNFRRSWSKGNKTTTRPVTPAPLAAFLDVDALSKKGVNVTLLSATAFQVTLTRKTIFHPMVEYLASTTNGTNVTGIVTVVLPKRVWWKAAEAGDEDLEVATFNHNKTFPVKNLTRPVKPAPQPKPFFSLVSKRIARNESTTNVTVADINGVRGGIKAATWTVRPNLATLTSAVAGKHSQATVGFNATVSNTSFTITLNNKFTLNWITVAVTGVSADNTTAQGTVSVKITRSNKI